MHAAWPPPSIVDDVIFGVAGEAVASGIVSIVDLNPGAAPIRGLWLVRSRLASDFEAPQTEAKPCETADPILLSRRIGDWPRGMERRATFWQAKGGIFTGFSVR